MGIPRPAATSLGLAGWASFGWARRPREETGLSVRCREGAARQERGDGAASLPSPPAPTPTCPNEAQGSWGAQAVQGTKCWGVQCRSSWELLSKSEKYTSPPSGPRACPFGNVSSVTTGTVEALFTEISAGISPPSLLFSHDVLSALGVDSGGLGGRARAPPRKQFCGQGCRPALSAHPPNPVPQPLNLGLGGVAASHQRDPGRVPYRFWASGGSEANRGPYLQTLP